MSRLLQIVSLALSQGIPRRSLVVAVVIGSILNLINQGDALMAGANLFKLFLTYIVPYCVATYGAVSLCLKDELRLGA
jgi:hypothetical protein